MLHEPAKYYYGCVCLPVCISVILNCALVLIYPESDLSWLKLCSHLGPVFASNEPTSSKYAWHIGDVHPSNTRATDPGMHVRDRPLGIPWWLGYLHVYSEPRVYSTVQFIMYPSDGYVYRIQ